MYIQTNNSERDRHDSYTTTVNRGVRLTVRSAISRTSPLFRHQTNC